MARHGSMTRGWVRGGARGGIATGWRRVGRWIPAEAMVPVRAVLVSAVATAWIGSGWGCSSEPLPERQPVVYEDFGHEVYRILHREMRISDHAPEAKMAVLEENKEDLIWALNQMVESPVDEGLQGALEAILPRYEPEILQTPCGSDAECGDSNQWCDPTGLCAQVGKIPRISRRLHEILTLLSAPQFAALSKFSASYGAPPDAMNRLLYRVLSYDEELFPPLQRLVAEQEPTLTEILRWAHRKILDMAPAEPVTHPTFWEKLLVPVDSTLDTGSPAWAIVLDDNGNPVVNQGGGGGPMDPFVDANGDGLVDTDAYGRPVDDQGTPIVLPVFSERSYRGEGRDDDGRALGPGKTLYQYFDVKGTLLGHLLWNLHPQLEQGILWNLFTAFEGLLGPKVSRVDDDGPYPGFDGRSNPIMDLMHALREIRRYPRLPQLLQTLKAVIVANPQIVEQLLTELGKTLKIFEGPDRLRPGNTLFDDLHPELEHWAQIGAFREILLALLDPRVDGLPQALYNMMAYTDIDVVYPPQDLACSTVSECQGRIQEVSGLGFTGMTPWSEPDDTLEKRSIQQKFAALVWDTLEVEDVIYLFNWLPINSMQITDDMATYYAEAMAGVAELSAGGIDGSTVVPFIPEFEDKYPSAEELGLFMNHSHGVLGDPVCKQGLDVKDHLGRYLLAFQATGGLEAFKPIAEAFARVDDVHAFTQLMSVLHFHYSSQVVDDPNGITTQYGTNVRALEEPLARTVHETELLQRAVDLVRAMAAISVSYRGETLDPIQELADFLGYLLDTSGNLRTYDGKEWVLAGDGTTHVQPISRLYLLFHAFDRMDALLDQDPTAKAAWDDIDLADTFLGVDANGHLTNPTTVPIVLNLVPILADELSERFTEPDYLTDLDAELDDLETFFSSRGFSYLYDVVLLVRDDPRYADLKALLDDLLVDATDASRTGEQDLYGALLAVLSDLVQSRIDVNAGQDLLRWFGEVITPDDRILFDLVDLLGAVYQDDPERVFTELMRNLFREVRPGDFPVNVLGRVIKAIHRVDPSERGPYTAEDFEHILGRLADYLVDEERGLERMYYIINHRK